MTDFTTCPKCGSELPADAPGGICPRCLMLAGLNFQAESGDEVSGSEYARTTPQPGSFVAPGLDLLAPHFPQLELGALLGQGGMGAVYKARQTKLDRTVALKIIRPESASDSAFAERFNREARTLARLSHPHIVGVHDFGEVKIPDPADPSAPLVTLYYFLMEYVDGVNLRQLMEAGDLTPETTLSVISQICDALQFAHNEGIVHRDIKPENVLLDRKGRVKIADFGLAKLASRSEQDFTLTGTHQVMGTPRYMAPEQMAGSRAVDHRADIYSLGVVFYEMLTGEAPAGHFGPPSKFASIDPRLDDVVMKALAQKPDDRFQSASEIRSSVETISRGERGTVLSKPERSPARGFSTIFEREVGAAWNWVVHPEQAKRDSARPETAAFPRLLFVALAVLGGLTMFLPWAEIRIAQDTAVTSIERGARLTEAVEQTIPATAVWSSAAASGTCFLMLIVLILFPHRRSPGLIASGVLTLFSLAAFIHTLAYQEELPWSGSVTLPLEVRGQDAARLEASSAASTGDRAVTDSAAIASKVYTFRQKVSLKFFPDLVTYREGFYASLGLTLSLLFFSIISVRNAIMNREPKKETSETWSGTPLASLRFAVPAKGDLGTNIKFHFSGLGYELVDEPPGMWIFQRGRLASAFLDSDIRLYPTRLTVNTVKADDQHWLINCHWSVRLMGSWAGKKDIQRLEDEGRELQALLQGQIASPGESATQTMGESADLLKEPAASVSHEDAVTAVKRESARRTNPAHARIDFNAAEEEVSQSAIGMMVIGAISSIAHFMVMVTVLEESQTVELMWLAVPGILIGLVLLAGGIGLHRLRSLGWAQVGIVAGFLPLTPAFLFSMIISILALQALAKPEVKLAFREKARRGRGSFPLTDSEPYGSAPDATSPIASAAKRATEADEFQAAPADSSSSSSRFEQVHPVAVRKTRRAVRGPGIALMLYGLVLLFPVVLLFANGLDIADGNDGTPWGVGVMMVVGSLCLLGLCGLLIRGGWHMVALEKYNAALIASFLGQPVGLWGLMVLGRPDVKSAFAAGPTQKMREQSAEPAHRIGTSDLDRIKMQVKGPAGGLIVVALLGLMFPVVLAFLANQNVLEYRPERTATSLEIAGFIGAVCLILSLIAITFIGALKMRRLESYEWCMTATILALFPWAGGVYLISLPIGIWALRTLRTTEVRDAFIARAAERRDRELLRRQHSIPNPFARTLLYFFTLIGILLAVSVLVYLLRGGGKKDSATVAYSETHTVADNAAGVSDAAQADRIRQLLAAAAAGDTGRVKTLLDAGASVNSKNESAQTPLMQAAANGHASLVTTLILLGADPNEQDLFGQTALMMAVSFRHEPVRKAIEKLEEVSQIKDPEERQAKLKSLPGLDKRLTDGLELDLAELKIDPRTQDSRGETVLMKAAKSKNLPYLREADYDHRVMALQDSQGRTALMFAIETGDLEFLGRLMELERTLFYFDEQRNVAINDFQIHPLLDPRSLHKTNRHGLTALQLAERLGQRELATAIREELNRFIQRATQAIESGNESPEYLAQFLKFRGQAYLALGDKEKADADFKQSESPL